MAHRSNMNRQQRSISYNDVIDFKKMAVLVSINVETDQYQK